VPGPRSIRQRGPPTMVKRGKSAGRRHSRWRSFGIRTGVAAIAGAVVGGGVSVFVVWQAAVLVGWSACALVFLVWTWQTIAPMSADQARAHARVEDPSRRSLEVIVLVAGVAMLTAVGLILVKAGQSHGASKAWFIAVGIASVILSWATVHTVFTLRYARTYYQAEGGVDFNEDGGPDYLDFAYLALTIGMTFQVSDTDLKTKSIRRVALSHALLSYLFGAVIVALIINVVASLLG